MYNKSKWTLVVIVLFFILSCSGSSGSGGGGGGDDAVSVNTLDGTADVPIGSTFAYTFSEAVDSATVTSSTFFIVSMPQQGGGDEPQGADAIVRKTEYDDTICNADNALTASVGYTAADLQATLDPESDLSYNTSYAICLTTGITYASGSAFEGFMALFNTEALQCDNSSITTYSYMMAFQSCDPDEDCSDPRNHMLYLAGSNDGASWSLIEEFESISGSVPGLVFYNDYLYIFHTQGDANWQKYNACFEVVGAGDANISGDDSESGWVDPSLIVSGDDLILFYLPGRVGGDPAGCGDDYPCTKEIHSAIADDESLTNFTQQDGNRASMYIASDEAQYTLFCDPDILVLADGSYLLYISVGGGTLVYEGTSLSQTFEIPGGGSDPVQISSAGGVPGAFQSSDGSVWLYVNKSNTELLTHSIARGVSADGITPISDGDFSVVLDYTISSAFTEERSTGSPSIISWPGDSWSRNQAPSNEEQ